MYNIDFYRKGNGKSEIEDFLDFLNSKSLSDKDARIQLNQLTLCIQLLIENGTRLPILFSKHLEDGIWELRPGKNRVLYFYFGNNTFILLHYFRKKTQKTPRREIEKAKAERADFLSRKETK